MQHGKDSLAFDPCRKCNVARTLSMQTLMQEKLPMQQDTALKSRCGPRPKTFACEYFCGPCSPPVGVESMFSGLDERMRKGTVARSRQTDGRLEVQALPRNFLQTCWEHRPHATPWL